MHRSPDFYRKAYTRYLRRGTPLDITLKAATRPTPYYIWRTRGDDKVRTAHAENNGRIFAWDNPPTGNPGEDYNCRCLAEPYTGSISANVMQALRNYLLDYLYETYPWENTEMSLYYFLGNGQGVTLEQMGHLERIRDYYTQHYLIRFQDQIRKNAAYAPLGVFQDNFDKSYGFINVIFSYGDSTVEGTFNGKITQLSDGTKLVSGNMYFRFSDTFKDPLDVGQTYVFLRNAIPYLTDIKEVDLAEWFKEATNLWQKPYLITGKWEMSFTSLVAR